MIAVLSDEQLAAIQEGLRRGALALLDDNPYDLESGAIIEEALKVVRATRAVMAVTAAP